MKLTRTEAGAGGRRGHSNMAHHDPTAIVKRKARKARRQADRIIANER